MLPVSFIAIVFTLGLSVFLNTSFHSFKDYNHQLKDLNNWQETSLAAAKRVSIESSTLITSIKSQLNSCLDQYGDLKTAKQRTSFQCETDFENSFEEFKLSLNASQTNQLNSTIKYGLNPENTGRNYEDFSYKLFFSDKLPSAFKKGDDLYNSALIKASQLQEEINIQDFDHYLDSGKLNIKPDLLEALVGKENSKLIFQNPQQFNIKLSGNNLLEEKKLPNAIKLSINFKQRQSQSLRGEAEAIPELNQTFLSTGQLRTSADKASLVINTVCNTCGCPGIPCPPPPPPPVFNTLQHQITFNQFDNVSGRGIFFDSSQDPSIQNQINIINTDQGRFTSIYPTGDNYLQINIGSIAKSSSVLTQNTNRARQSVNPKLVNFATVTFTQDPPPGHQLNITGTSNISVDIVPRARKRYMTAKKDFVVNGQTIPKGSILVATLEPNSNLVNPQLKDFSTIRVYDQNTGALRQIFKPEDRNMNQCAAQACMEISQFSTAGSNPSLPGSKVLTSFSTKDLFQDKDFYTANKLFTSIQRDLEVNSVTGIYGKKHDWQKIIVEQDLNSEQQVLLTKIFKENNSNTRSGRIKIADLLGYSFVKTGNTTKDSLQERLIDSFVEFADLKLKALEDPTRKKKEDSQYAKNKFLSYRSVYQDYQKNKINSISAKNKLLALDLKYSKNNGGSGNTTTNNNQGGSNTTTTVTKKPDPPVAPNCLSKKPKNRSNKCKKNIKQYKKLLASYQAKYG